MNLPECPKCQSKMTIDNGQIEIPVEEHDEIAQVDQPTLVRMLCLWCNHKWIAEYDQSWRNVDTNLDDIPF